ncbi:MAG: hypothetical protein DRK00_06665, partial [Thermoprotei archaeon]
LILYVMGIDISADLPIASLVYVGHFYQAGSSFLTAKLYGVRSIVTDYVRIVSEYLNETGLPEEKGLRLAIRNLGLVRQQDLTEGPEWMWASTMSKPYVLDTEPFTIAGMAAFTFKTSFSFKPLEGEPISDLTYVKSRFRDRVIPQLASALAIAVGLLNEPEIKTLSESMILPTRLHPLLYWGFIDLRVRVLEYNVTKGWYDPVPHAIVRVSRANAYNYPFVWMIAKADHEGSALIYGITPQSLGAWYVDAYKILNDSWAIMPAWGLHSTGPTWVTALVPRVYATVNVKPLKIHVLTDLYNPRIMRRTIEDPRFSTANVWIASNVWPSSYETTTGMLPLYYYAAVSDKRGLGLIGSSLPSKLTITLGIGRRWPVAIAEITNAAPILSALNYAKDLYRLASQRYSTLSTREVRKLSADLMLKYARAHLDKVTALLKSKEYGDAYRYSLIAWSYSARAYADEVMPLYEESVRSVIIFAPLIIVSAYFFERLLLRGKGIRRIFYTVGLEVTLFAAFAVVHPAFWIIPSTLLASLSIGLLILMAVVFWIFYREARDLLSEVSAKILGRHEVTGERIPVILMTLSLSIENMRKRPLRTILTIVPITVFAMAMISLASISPYTAVIATVTDRKAPYWGLLVKNFYGVLESTLDNPTVELISALVGERGVVCPRFWYYPPAVIGHGPYGLIISSNSSARVPAVVGFTSVEAEKLVRRALIKGTTFIDDYQLAIILPSTLAERLEVDVGDEVEFLGMRLVVTGIFSEAVLEAIRDFDGLSVAPMNSVYYPQLHGFAVNLPTVLQPLPLAWEEGVVIMPAGLVEKLGGFISSIGIVLKPNITYSEAEVIARRIAYAIDAVCYASNEAGNVVAYSKVPTFSAVGWEMMFVPFVLTSLNIVVTLLGSIKERTAEIYTYTSVGLSPGGAMLMFIVEFLVYGFLGAIVGYFSGWAASKILRWIGVLSTGFVFNYASVSIVIVIIMVILSTLIAAVYPSYLASRLVTPSLERKWRMPRAPRSIVWEIPLPFRVSSGREAQAILLYLQEYYGGVGSMKRLYRVTTDPKVLKEERKLSFNVWLYPFDAATEQKVELYFIKERKDRWRAILRLRLVKGLRRVWISGSQYSFLNDLRKQLLLWRTLPASEREKYLRMLQEYNP